MGIERSATPLVGLDAVVIDTETTGLDVRKARVVEIAAVRLTGGHLDGDGTLRRLVDPGEPIPAEAAQIHGIDDNAVAGAPRFAAAWPEVARYLGDAVLIGHTVDFDLAMLRRECERAALRFTAPPVLDIRLLGELVEPRLADFSMESLAALLGVDVEGRHSALGDAMTTARIFLALVPKLRDRGLRTLAEAQRASHELVARRRTAVGPAVSAPPPLTAETKPRIDARLYSERVRSIMTSPPLAVARVATIKDALALMEGRRASSVFVSADGEAALAKTAGIVTERDVLRAVAKHGAGALAMPIEAIASRPLLTVASDEFAYKAVARMNRLRVRHLGVTDADGRVIGALSARDLLRLRAEAGVELGDEIELAADTHTLARAWSKLPQVAADLVREGLSARQVAALVSRRCCELTARAAAMAEQAMQAQGNGPPPAAYALLVLGSAGRGESLLAMDQDNALVFADGAPDGADGWFEAFAVRVADILHEAGVPYCKGGVMAKNPQWRGSLQQWQGRVERWIERSNPEDLLSVDIFFDLQAVHGAIALADELMGYALDRARGQAGFAKLLIDASGPTEPSLNWFGGIRTTEGRIDLKRAGLFGIVRSARALAIVRHVESRSTLARIEAVKASGAGAQRDLDALIEAQDVFLDLILRQQLVDIERGRPPGNSAEVKRLSWRERERLRTALRAVEHLDELTQSLLFSS